MIHARHDNLRRDRAGSEEAAPVTGAAPRTQAADKSAAAAGLSVENVTHSFRSMRALDDVSFDVAKGGVVALLGPSGCGKSTLLRVIAGLLPPDRGRISLGDRDLTRIPARKRSIGMVFQNFALFPHLTVRENIAYGLVSRSARKAETQAQVQEMLRLVRLEELGDRFPRQLSGGQQQRVAVARALAVSPSALLLDEPFGALDRALRAELQEEFIETQSKVGITTVVVTHDQEEAQMVASLLVVMNKGRIEQIGTPEQIYDHPETLFVNTFMGRANLFPATVKDDRHVELSTGETVRRGQGAGFLEGTAVVLTARPEHVTIAPSSDPEGIAATWVRGAPQAQHLLVDLELSDGSHAKALIPRLGGARFEPGAAVKLRLDPTATQLFPANDPYQELN